MKKIQLSLSLVLFFAILLNLPHRSVAQYEKDLSKALSAYTDGDYEGAKRDIDKIREKSIKKLGENNKYIPIVLVRQAIIQSALGILVDVIPLVDEAVSKSEEINGTESADHAFILKEACEAMIHYGHFQKAAVHLANARKSFDASAVLTPEIAAELDVLEAQVLSGKGFNREAIKFIDNQIGFYQEQSEADAGSKKANRLADRDYATLMITKGVTIGNMGNWQSADSVFRIAEEWIRDNLSRADLNYSLNKFYQTKLLEDNGLRIDVAIDEYEKAHVHLLRRFQPSHWLAMELKERITSGYLKEERSPRYRKAREDYEKTTKKNYPRNSVNFIKMDLVEFDQRIENDATRNLENKVQDLLSDEAMPAQHIRRLELLDYAYNASMLKKNYTNAEGTLDEIVEIKRELYGEDSPEFHLAKLKRANFYVDYTDKYEEASETYQSSFSDFVAGEITEGHIDYIEILNHMASYYEANDYYEEASDVLNQALLASRRKYDNEDMAYAIELEKIGALQLRLGEYDAATENIDLAKKIFRKQRDEVNPLYMAKTLVTEAKLFAIKGLYDEASDNLKDAEKIQKNVEASFEVIAVSSDEDLAGLLINVGRFREAERLLDKSLKNYQKRFGESSRFLIEPLTLMGRIDLLKGDYAEAQRKANKANSMSKEIFGDLSTKNAPSIKLLAETHSVIGDYEISENYIQEMRDILIARYGNDHIDVANATSQLALNRYYRGEDLGEVRQLFVEAERTIGANLGSKNPTYAEILKNLAIVYIANEEYDEAFDALDEAGSIWEERIGKRTNLNAAVVNILKGDIYYKRRNYEKADDYYSRAKKKYEDFFSTKHPEYVRVMSKLSRTYYMSGDNRKAERAIDEVLQNYKNFIQFYFRALSEREKAKFWNTIKSDYEFYNTLALKLTTAEDDYVGKIYNNALLTKALLLNSSIKIKERILNSNDEQLIATYNDWLEKKEILTFVLSMSSQELSESGVNQQDLSKEVEALERVLSERSEFGAKSETVTWDLVQNALQPGEIAMEMVRFRHFSHTFTDSVMYAVIHIDHDKKNKPKMILLDNGKDLETRYLKYYRNSMKFRLEDAYSYEAFWKPIEERFAPTAKIFLSPDGVYNQVNIESMRDSEGTFMIDKANLILVSNTKDIFNVRLNPRKVQEERRATMIGNPTFYVDDPGPLTARASGGSRTKDAQVITQLPGTEREIVELRGMLTRKGWNITDQVGGTATEDYVKKIENPRLVHFATHGFFQTENIKEDQLDLNQNKAFENPLLRAGLLLAGAGDIFNETDINYNVQNGVLTAYEAMNMNLDQTELVVLSACETGLGEVEAGEGVMGLQRAFLVAGAEAIIMSLFKVSDDVTQKLMVSFYEKWLATGNKRQSFLEAKKEIREEYVDPIYWGPFIMIGMTE